MEKAKPSTPDPKGSRTWEQLEEFARAHVQHFIQALLEGEVTECIDGLQRCTSRRQQMAA